MPKGRRTITLEIHEFKIGTVLDETKDSTFGRLPAVGLQDISNLYIPYAPEVLAERYPDSLTYRDVIMNPTPVKTVLDRLANPQNYKTPYGGPADLFWKPQSLAITEELVDAAPIFQSEVTRNVAPAGTLIGDNYVWHGSGLLNPTFETASESATNDESNAAFLAGIFFGVAGAAAIALVQEFPETLSAAIPTFKGRRRSLRRAHRS